MSDMKNNVLNQVRAPSIYWADELKGWPDQANKGGRWVSARPYRPVEIRLIHRLKLAWLVFTGRCDVLKWSEDHE